MHYPINYFKEDISIDLRRFQPFKKWLLQVGDNHNVEIEEVNYIFCSDEYLYNINMEYLNHDTYTDIITFDNRDNESDKIQADIFISIDRVIENAKTNNTNFTNEISRVMVHGLLHLIGYKDKTSTEKHNMREAENNALNYLPTSAVPRGTLNKEIKNL